MKQATRHTFAVLLAACAVAGSANARYLCDKPQEPLDKRACAAAEEGPQALRRFIERMRPIATLDFHDYVNEARWLAWAESDKRARAQAGAPKPDSESSAEARR